MIRLDQSIYFFHDEPEKLAGYDSRDLVPNIVWHEIRLMSFNSQPNLDDQGWDRLAAKILQNKQTLSQDLEISKSAAELFRNQTGGELLWPTGSKEELAILKSKFAYDYIRFVLQGKVNQLEYVNILAEMDPDSLARIMGAQSNLGASPFSTAAERRILDQVIAPHASAVLLFSIISHRRIPSAERNIRHMTSLKWQQIKRLLNRYGTDAHDTAWDYYLRCLGSAERTGAIRSHGID